MSTKESNIRQKIVVLFGTTLHVYMRSNERSTGSVIIALAFVSEHQAREIYIVIYFRCTQPRFSRTESTTIRMPPVRRADVCFPILAGKLSLSAYIEDDAMDGNVLEDVRFLL